MTAALFQGTDRLPFFYRWVEGQMIVTRDFTPDHRLPPGTIVERIDGIAAANILQRLLPLVRADGANDAKRNDLLQVQGTDTYEAADVLLPMVLPNWKTPFDLAVKTPGRKRTTNLTEQAVSFGERKREGASVRVDPKSGNPLFTLRYLSGGETLLTMPTWLMYQGKWDWRTWLNQALDEIVARQSPTLIIDLRGNAGGDDVGQVILDRLPRTGSAPAPYERLVRYRKIPAELNPFLKTWDKSFKDWGNRAVELPEPWPTAPPVPYLRQIGEGEKPNEPVGPTPALYTGKVFALTDAANSSATYGFARIIQTEHLGKLVGQPTGGNKRGTNGGAFFFVHLPYSGLEVDLPLIGYFPSSPEPDEGLQPDISVGSVTGINQVDPSIRIIESIFLR